MNGGFEVQTSCPFGFLTNAVPWQEASILPAHLYDTCVNSTNVYYGVPVNLDSSLGYQFPHSGHAYAGFNVYLSNQQNSIEYLLYEFSNPLQLHKKYCLSFYINLNNANRYGVDAIGAYFSDSSLSCVTYPCLINCNPQVSNPVGNIILDTLGWTEISGCFTAEKELKYMIIGNFTPDSLIQRDTNRYIPSWDYSSLYYIDDVSLYEDSSNAITELSKNLSVSVSPNPATNTLKITNGEQLELFDLKVYNNTGTQVFFQQAIQPNEAINIDALSNGFYYFIVATEKGEFATGKIVVQKDK